MHTSDPPVRTEFDLHSVPKWRAHDPRVKKSAHNKSPFDTAGHGRTASHLRASRISADESKQAAAKSRPKTARPFVSEVQETNAEVHAGQDFW
jgi:hypothetical protein